MSEYDDFGAFKPPPPQPKKKKEKDFVRIALDFIFCSWNGEKFDRPKNNISLKKIPPQKIEIRRRICTVQPAYVCMYIRREAEAGTCFFFPLFLILLFYKKILSNKRFRWKRNLNV